MASTFEMATRAAIKEIISKNVSESKFGFVMTHDALAEICDDIFNLLITSRNLKSAGDRWMAKGGMGDLPRKGSFGGIKPL
ncbi:MAG: hypothetical protein ACOH5I_12220 [Oligoflexus sp.]